jgi:LPS export ABC transporter protein LptC
MKKVILVALLAALAMLPALRLEKENAGSAGLSPRSFLEGVSMVTREEGELLWSLESGRVSFSADMDTASLEGVSVELPGQEMLVTASSGEFDMDGHDLSLSGNVRAETRGFVVTTASASLESGTGRISTDDPVSITGGDFVITGKGLRAANSTVRLLADVKAEFH